MLRSAVVNRQRSACLFGGALRRCGCNRLVLLQPLPGAAARCGRRAAAVSVVAFREASSTASGQAAQQQAAPAPCSQHSAASSAPPRRDFLEARQVSLYELFDGSNFQLDIPSYQRPFAWRAKQVRRGCSWCAAAAGAAHVLPALRLLPAPVRAAWRPCMHAARCMHPPPLQVHELLSDLRHAYVTGQEHFLGAVVTTRQGDSPSGSGPYWVRTRVAGVHACTHRLPAASAPPPCLRQRLRAARQPPPPLPFAC